MGFFKRLFSKRDPAVEYQLKQMAQVTAVYQSVIEGLSVALFMRAVQLVEKELPDVPKSHRDAIAAHVKLYCTGEGENSQSLKASTEEDRSTARTIATEIMAIPVAGIYLSGDAEAFANQIQELPVTREAIKQIALAFDQIAALLVLNLNMDYSGGLQMPIVNHEQIQKQGVPLIENALLYDPNSSPLRASAAQFYYSQNRLDEGFRHAVAASDLDPQNAEAWRLVGNGWMMQGRDADARIAFQRALSIAPNIEGVHEALSLLHD